MNVVLRNLTGKQLTSLPSAGAKSRLLIEAKTVTQKQIVDAMLTNENDLPDQIDPNTYIGNQGNCLHQDATSKFHKHYDETLNAGCKTQMSQCYKCILKWHYNFV